ncbi:ring-cleaving dioxygenase [Virgibacillus sp. MSP4-1]|uniref:ring-cleaving dioxygenase n=1 Tax=Virgibacillus sp. MSP4-1 TaxID=2700081 RepID=UPI00039C8F8D|nr:ring-cleaving dioxygenase [Virgibacillus sp. MSP4-1]QHS21531.1 ring-cleaving dioxygenase [Virgibacillus sp. MSP4-1]
MAKATKGVHHITAIAGDPQENMDFYAGILGLRFVKKTVNFDDPGTYHFYFGDENGSPGTIMTFFPVQDALKGRVGSGQVGVTSFVVPLDSLSFWEKRLAKFDIDVKKSDRFGERSLEFEDVHGLRLELVEREKGPVNDWSFGEVTPDVAIKGFGGATLYSREPGKTAELLTELMGLEKTGEEEDIIRLQAYGDIGNVIDIKQSAVIRGLQGAGTIHHIAFRTDDDDDQLEWQSLLQENGYQVTPVQDRNYFNSVYFREHGHILFEIATDSPGFMIDEGKEQLGESLRLPEWYEPHRERIENILLPVDVRELD